MNGNRYAGFVSHGCDCGRTDGTTAKADAINKQAAETGKDGETAGASKDSMLHVPVS